MVTDLGRIGDDAIRSHVDLKLRDPYARERHATRSGDHAGQRNGTRKLADSRTCLGDAVALSAAEHLQPVLGLLELTGPMIGKGQVPGGVAP